MANRNTKKVLRWIYAQSDTFHPSQNPESWNHAVKYVQRKDKTLKFNAIFRPLYAQIFKEDVDSFLAGGHKLTHELKKGFKENAKDKAKEIIKAQLASQITTEQDPKESQGLLPEG